MKAEEIYLKIKEWTKLIYAFNSQMIEISNNIEKEFIHKSEMKEAIKLNAAEIQSRFSRVAWAEALILQLPKDHEGRNSWLLNYGVSFEAQEFRKKNGVAWVDENKSAELKG
jgi:hypothetical protein